MKVFYTKYEVQQLISQAVNLKVPLYRGLTIQDIDTLVKNELIKLFEEPIKPSNLDAIRHNQ